MTFAGHAVKGTKRFLTTENKSRFLKKSNSHFSISSEKHAWIMNAGWKKVTQGEKRLLPFLLWRGERGNFNIWLTLFTATRRVCVFAESALSLACHLPFLDPCTIVHVHQHQCTTPPSLKSQSRKGSDWWVGWVFYPFHCSWHPSTSRHGPSALWAPGRKEIQIN